MGYILNIDTALETSCISLAENGAIIQYQVNRDQKMHASFLHNAIKEIAAISGINLSQLDAIAVSAGPGSYTGIRVGMAGAKGLSYALNIPLIPVNTLKMMAFSSMLIAQKEGFPAENSKPYIFCPMIDARRDEVYTALYSMGLMEIMAPSALILSGNFLEIELQENTILFNGSGSQKFISMLHHQNFKYLPGDINPEALNQLGYEIFQKGSLRDAAHVDPVYLKDFHILKNVKI